MDRTTYIYAFELPKLESSRVRGRQIGGDSTHFPTQRGSTLQIASPTFRDCVDGIYRGDKSPLIFQARAFWYDESPCAWSFLALWDPLPVPILSAFGTRYAIKGLGLSLGTLRLHIHLIFQGTWDESVENSSSYSLSLKRKLQSTRFLGQL